jgi:hypothetical protein
MISVVKTKLENKTDKQFIYYIGSSKIILDPCKPVIVNGDIFTRETRQEGNTEGLLVNIYNGNITLTLIVDDTFVTDVKREAVTVLPKRSQDKLINKDGLAPDKEIVKEEPKTELKEESKAVVKEEPKKAEPVKVETTKVEQVKEEPKVEAKEDASLNNIVVEDIKPKNKKATKL